MALPARGDFLEVDVVLSWVAPVDAGGGGDCSADGDSDDINALPEWVRSEHAMKYGGAATV